MAAGGRQVNVVLREDRRHVTFDWDLTYDQFISRIKSEFDGKLSADDFIEIEYLDGDQVVKIFDAADLSKALAVQGLELPCLMVKKGERFEHRETLNEVPVQFLSISGIEIKTQPQSQSVSFGQTVTLTCEAVGNNNEQLHYQWHEDGKKLRSETKGTLVISHKDNVKERRYICNVRDGSGNYILSNEAIVTLRTFYPSDKVAVLIGNSKYAHHTFLPGVHNAVVNFTTIFRRLNFKVVPLVNLSKVEMKNAMSYILDITCNGAYLMFSLSGHGFEENGVQYLLPVDCPSLYGVEDGISLAELHNMTPTRQLYLKVFIIDACRQTISHIPNTSNSSLVPRTQSSPEEQIQPNTVWCFATSFGYQSFESGHVKRTYLDIALLPLLEQRIGIIELFCKLVEQFDFTAFQRPDIRSNLREHQRSLTDIIVRPSENQAVESKYENIWTLPEPYPFKIENTMVKGALSFTPEQGLANMLNVSVALCPTPEVRKLHCNVSMKFAPQAVIPYYFADFENGGFIMTKVVVENIQKLKENLQVNIEIQYTSNGERVTKRFQTVEFLPMAANMKLWSTLQ